MQRRALLDSPLNLFSDENRDRVITHRHWSSILARLDDPKLLHVTVPIIYNICMDYGMCLHLLHEVNNAQLTGEESLQRKRQSRTIWSCA